MNVSHQYQYGLAGFSVVVCIVVFSLFINADAQEIVIGPNVQVSRDGNVAHVESYVAANPRNPQNILGSAITFTSPAVGPETKAYISLDGGWTWTDRFFPDQRQHGAGDAQVSFGVTGTAYFVTLKPSNDTATHSALVYYRSEDGGLTWSKPIYMGSPQYDRNTIVVDNSQGRFHGRVYVTSHTSANGRSGAQLFWSSDDGRTFHGPISTHCQQDINYLVVLSDGALWIPCSPKNTAGGPEHVSYSAMISNDGGKTLTPIAGPTPSRGTITHRHKKPGEVSGFMYEPLYVADTSKRFRDRIYALWLQGDDENPAHIMIKYSDDRGRTWSVPSMMARPSQADATQYLPMATVNRDGLLGVIWFEALPPNYDIYDVFFTASVNGGDTFLPPRRVTSATSKPDRPENRAITQIAGPNSELRFFSAYSRWKDAGDYTGLAADSQGVFHALWPDARRGAFQLYTSRIDVMTKPGTSTCSSQTSDALQLLDREVNVEFGPPVVPRDSADEILVARLRNVSKKTICGPLSITVRLGESATASERLRIFDPRTGSWAEQAHIDYTPALRDIPFLEPSAATEAIEWHFRDASGAQLNLITHVFAGGAPPQ